ncbi:hypothetical protein VUR80DRAFT_1343 [Thermomyces stellatus]
MLWIWAVVGRKGGFSCCRPPGNRSGLSSGFCLVGYTDPWPRLCLSESATSTPAGAWKLLFDASLSILHLTSGLQPSSGSNAKPQKLLFLTTVLSWTLPLSKAFVHRALNKELYRSYILCERIGTPYRYVSQASRSHDDADLLQGLTTGAREPYSSYNTDAVKGVVRRDETVCN